MCIRRYGIVGAIVAVCFAAEAGAAEKPAEKPNVLFLAIDDLNDWIGVYGKRTDVKTPNMDRLAGRGVLFTRAYCAAPACNPSRAALMTGVRPSTSGVYHNSQPWRPAMPDRTTLTQHFMASGYKVHGGGKIFHNTFNDPASWQHYQRTGAFAEPKRRSMPGTAHFDWGAIEGGDESMGDTQVVDWAIDFLKQPHDRPFFLAAGMIRPHLPFYAPRKYFELYPLSSVKRPVVKADDLADVPPAGIRMARPQGDHRLVLEAGEWEHAVQSYLACISYVDGQIGRLIDALDASPHARNTIVILWSDHGWHLGEKEHWRKFALWEEATRVTCMAVVPGVTQPGQRCDRTVSLLDLYPTLIELCGLPPRDGLEGQSLVPLLRNPSAPRREPALTTHGKGDHAVRTERWRYIRYADGSEELYDHDADPLEWTNLAQDVQHAPVKEELARWLPAVNAADAPTQAERNPRKGARQGKRKTSQKSKSANT